MQWGAVPLESRAQVFKASFVQKVLVEDYFVADKMRGAFAVEELLQSHFSSAKNISVFAYIALKNLTSL